MTQKEALEILKMGHNVFLTGPAGSGKTFVSNKFIKYLRENNIKVAVTASTGIAATHLGGTTIHSWSGLGIIEKLDKKTLKKIAKKRKLGNRILKTATLIIDEISMLGASQLDGVDKICRTIRENDIAFGGMQVVFCGDFFQLPPVKRAGEEENRFAYASDVWREIDLKVCYLDEQHRQKDKSLTRILNDIRKNSVSEETIKIVESCKEVIFKNHKPAKLFTHNADVDKINSLELGKIYEKPYAYNMQSDGKEKYIEFLKKSCLAPERLVLKKGAHVMFVKNSFEEGYVNGTMGKIIGFSEERKFPIVKTFCGKEITASPATWVFEEDGIEFAKIKQIPLRLAWAITVHKSQGMSLDAAEIDLSKTFEYGMGYVAISRVRSLEGLRVIGTNKMAFEVCQDSLKMDIEFISQSASALKEIDKMNEGEREERKEEFLENNRITDEEFSGKNFARAASEVESEKTYSLEDIRKKFPKAYMSWTEEEERELEEIFLVGKSVKEMAKIFQRKRGAISSRLKKLGLIEED